jgi:D-arabinose 1-dehydrogenase-like Zn-dependent alcohol dehydrogenase
VKAAALTAYNEFELIDVPDPQVEDPQDVVIKVAGAGVCGSDQHLSEGELRAYIGEIEFPFILGHENCGHVVSVGAGVKTVAPGDPVLLHPHISCGLCRACRRGDETFCERLRFPGVDGTPGGFAEFMKTSERALIKLPDGTDPFPLAALTDAGLTAYHAVRGQIGDLPPDGTAVVIGLGGVGRFVLELLSIFSPARLVAVDISRDHLAIADSVGATAVLGDENAAAAIREAAGGRGADLVVDCVGVKGTPELAIEVLDRGGHLSVVGAGDGEVCCATPPMTGRELSFEASLVGTLGELTELVDIALRGRISIEHVEYPLAEAARAMNDLRSGGVNGRAVLRP